MPNADNVSELVHSLPLKKVLDELSTGIDRLERCFSAFEPIPRGPIARERRNKKSKTC
jgi:hypothetical protein